MNSLTKLILLAVLVLAVGAMALSPGCLRTPDADVVVYAALDGEFSEPILDGFAVEHDIAVASQFDTEAYKTVGLYRAIVAEKDRPRCDVFWNNEIIGTLRLQELGLLEPYQPPNVEDYPAQFRSPRGFWHGFAARARVLIVNTKLSPKNEWPNSIHDLTRKKWKGRCAMAKPLFGTTFTHACCLFGHWGDEQAREFFLAMKQNQVVIVGGNKDVAKEVATGQLAFGLTDTDDAVVFKEQGYPVEIIYPDRGQDELGTLFIPNTLAIIRGCPHPQAARKLVDYLLTPAVESRLARGPSAQIPLGAKVTEKPRVETPATVKAMPVDFADAAKKWDTASKFLRTTFAGK